MSQINNQSNSDRYLIFSLGKEEYAVQLLTVKQVIAKPEVTPVPQTPSYFLGIMNLRGQVISVLDLRAKLGIKPSENPENAVIIFNVSDVTIGVVVDSINSVLAPKPEEITDTPDIHSSVSHDYIDGVYRSNKRLVLFLNISKALGVKDIQAARSLKSVA